MTPFIVKTTVFNYEAFNWESSLGVNAFFDVETELCPRTDEEAVRMVVYWSLKNDKSFNMGFWVRGCETSIVFIQVGERMA
jgi:hypothetical protein